MEVAATPQSDIGRLVRVAMKHPRDAFVSQASIDAQWKDLGYSSAPDFRRACHEFDALVRLLEDHGAAIDLIPADEGTGLDSIYVRDACILTDRGIVVCNMGKRLRMGEPVAQRSFFAGKGLRLAGEVTGPGSVEGGDVTWLDERTLAIGHGYRTNSDGIRQVRALVEDSIDELIVVPLPHWHGVNDVMHLMSLISPIDTRLAAVYSRLLPVPFRTLLLDRGFTFVEVPDEEFESMGTNVLCIGERRVVTLMGNPRSRAALERAGVEVLEYEGAEISVKGAGGPTCLTRPLIRALGRESQRRPTGR